MPDLDLPILRREQIRAMGLLMQDAFFERLADHLASVFPESAERVQGPSGRALLESLARRARAYRLPEERSITLFVDLCFGLGLDFDSRRQYGWIKSILEYEDLSGSARLYLIFKRLPERCPGPPA
jgi:hypothetical protein